MFGKKKKLIEEQEKTIAELNGRLKEQQLQMEGLNSQLDEYKKREYAISRAITDAAEAADRILADAQKESDDIHDTAQKDFEASQQKGEDVVQNAYENARDIVKKAEEASEEKIRQTDEAVCAYVQLLNQFNESMKEQAKIVYTLVHSLDNDSVFQSPKLHTVYLENDTSKLQRYFEEGSQKMNIHGGTYGRKSKMKKNSLP